MHVQVQISVHAASIVHVSINDPKKTTVAYISYGELAPQPFWLSFKAHVSAQRSIYHDMWFKNMTLKFK